MSAQNHMTWKFFKEFPNRWNIENCIVVTTKSINPSESFPTIGILTMGGTGYRTHENITDLVIPKDTIGYFGQSNSGGNGTLVKFIKNMTTEAVDRRSIQDTIQLIEQNPNHIPILLSALDMESLQLYCNK